MFATRSYVTLANLNFSLRLRRAVAWSYAGNSSVDHGRYRAMSTAASEVLGMQSTKHILAVGDQLPDISLPGVDGRTIHLRDFRGKRLFIFMWASW